MMAAAPDSGLCSKIELSISCTDLKDLDTFSKSDPVVFLFEKRGQKWIKIGRTEMIDDNLNPKFARTFVVEYRFEEIQNLKFSCYDVDDRKHIDDLSKQEMIGEMECTLAEIVIAGQCYRRKLRYKGEVGGNIQIIGEEIEDTKFEVKLQLSAVKLDKKDFFGKEVNEIWYPGRAIMKLLRYQILSAFFTKLWNGEYLTSDPFFEISKAQEGGTFTLVYRSQPIMKTLNPKWPSFIISSQKLCSGDWERTLCFSVWDWNRDGTHDFIGEATTILKDISPERGGQTARLQLINPEIKKKKRKYTNSGILSFISVSTAPVYSFMDYIKGGCQVSLIVAIDFTASNGKPASPSSLHYNNPYRDNEYVTAIKSVASVLAPYDSDQQFPVFGFGAKFRHNGEVSHCFPLTFNPQRPEVSGVQGILDVYHYALSNIDLFGPTNFSSFLETTIKYASCGVSQKDQKYFILLVITDGEITDMDRTVDRIVQASSLPLSIVIVGVGEADFTKMETLDADDTPLIDRHGKRMESDIVQFVPLRKFHSRSGANFSLARETLAEIPNQFLGYMKKQRIKPNPPPLRKQETSFDIQQGATPPYPVGPNAPPYPVGQGVVPPYPT